MEQFRRSKNVTAIWIFAKWKIFVRTFFFWKIELQKCFFFMKIQRKNNRKTEFDKKIKKKISRLHTKNFNR